MKKELTIEVLDNGLLVRGSCFTEAVLYNEESVTDDDAQFEDCQRYVGKLLTDEIFGPSDLRKESDNHRAAMGKPVIAYKLEVNIKPLTEDEYTLKKSDA